MSTDMATLTGAYAVDALTEIERARFERHLAACGDCAQEVRELRETVTRLGLAAETAPPEDLKRRVLAEVSRTGQSPPGGGETGHRRQILRSASPWGMRLTAAAAVVGVALAATFGGLAWHSQQELAQARHRFEQVSESSMAMARLMEAPDARVVVTSQNGMKATTVMSEQLHRAMFMSTGIEQPPAGHSYQLWFLGPFGATSAGLIQQDRAGRVEPLVAPMPKATTAMGVTLEPAGGSSEPTNDPMMTMSL
ncbi:anti-sigma-K factor RskA [Saccharopolyspora lacisalsi]|uniref:Regulator of SigK n=1 Tax=Halosaccharopolyspora lacisalsi TaxID=1000566 RepID=A0A839DV29_9PSEU|nr:anti-sigma factor [Halosaccharopolyspora lacisalsi]MBA8823145.1 anti-sigma-K factor RskA [Halosaccharopolyspora lacisalsi]